MEWLKQLLGEELFNQLFPKESEALKKITEKVGAKKFVEDDGKLIPKNRFDELTTKKTEIENQLAKANEDLKKAQGDYDGLKAEKEGGKKTVDEQISALNKKIEELTNGISQKISSCNYRRNVLLLKAHCVL